MSRAETSRGGCILAAESEPRASRRKRGPRAAPSWAWDNVPFGELDPPSGQISWKAQPRLRDLTFGLTAGRAEGGAHTVEPSDPPK